jgi:hypothetical protein
LGYRGDKRKTSGIKTLECCDAGLQWPNLSSGAGAAKVPA